MTEINKPVKLGDTHSKKVAELQQHYKISARKLGQIVIALRADLESIPKKTRRFDNTKSKDDVSNIFIPFTKAQYKKANEKAKSEGYDFTSWFKIKLDEVHNGFKEGTLDLESNDNEIVKKLMVE